jgi:signal transduction histidine kinase
VQDVTVPEDVEANRDYARRLLRGDPRDLRWRGATASATAPSSGCRTRRRWCATPQRARSTSSPVVEDISERKRTEAALLAAQAAERANAAKTEFLSRMSHELRTPLNAVLGFSQLLQMDTTRPLTTGQKAKLQHIEDAGAHLLAMINDVLDLSRIEAGGMMLAPETLALSALVQESLALVATAARDAQVRLDVAPPPPDVPRGDRARADHLRLRQVLVNLLSNAIKYNRANGRVTVRWGATPEGDSVQLQVVDTGQGLTPQQRAHLFEPFNRLGASAAASRVPASAWSSRSAWCSSWAAASTWRAKRASAAPSRSRCPRPGAPARRRRCAPGARRTGATRRAARAAPSCTPRTTR